MTLNAGVPAEKGPPRNWGSFPPPAFGGLCRPEVGVPLPARRTALLGFSRGAAFTQQLGHGAPVSDRHRAGARNLHRRRWPCQSHGQERRSPTGIARERETRTDDAGHANLTARSAGLRPASRGSAKPAPMTPRPANLTAGAPVSDRHRAGARNLHRRRRAPPISRLERRSPTGIARERETSADDTAPCQRECRTPSQHRMPRSLTAPLPAAVPLLTAPAKTPANNGSDWRDPPTARATEPPLHLEGERQRGVGFCQGRSL